MSQRAIRQTVLSPEEYLEQELLSSFKREFVDGALYAMAGASARHGLVSLNLAAAISNHLPDRCEVFTADMKLRVKIDAKTFFYYPDVLVSCAPNDRATHFREQPILIIEVLSPSTARIDRTEKLDAYKTIPSLMEYVIADQDMPQVEVFRRSNAWVREAFYPEHRFTLQSVGLELTTAQIYRRVGF